MGHAPLLMIGIDGTLCTRRRTEETMGRWRERIMRQPPDPLPAALAALSLRTPVPVAVTTTRHECMRTPTRWWIEKHFPVLAGAPLLMRANDETDGIEVRREHVARSRAGRRVVLVDDQVEMGNALHVGDVLVVAPKEWPRLAEALERARRS